MKNDKNKIRIIHSLLKRSVDLLYENDNYLITNSVHEQSISHRIAYYLENLLRNYYWFVKDGYSVDVEYNKNLDEPKRVYTKCSDCKKLECCLKTSSYNINDYESLCRPDIIIHKRGHNGISQNDFNNLIVIEIKKENTKNDLDFSNDYAKLAAFTCDDNMYKYILGIFIKVNESKYRYFKNGQEVNENAI